MKLKKLFISLFGLLAFTPFVFADYVIINGISYNSYYEFDVGEPTQIGNFIYTFDSFGNLSTDVGNSNGLFAFTQWNNGPDYIYAYGWIDGKLYGFAHNTATQYTPEGFVQGFVSNFCLSDSLVGCAESSYSYSLEDVLNSIGTIQNVYFRIPGGGGLSLPYRNTNQGIFFYDGTNYFGTQFNLSDGGPAGLTGSLGLNFTNFEQLFSYNWGNSPFSSSGGGGGVSTGSINSAQNLYDSYRALGYQDVMCYGGFSLDDLLLTGNSRLNDLQVGSGATIFQLHQVYSGGMELGKWWNYYDFDYGFLVDYNEYEPFIGKSKGLVGLYMVRDTFFKRNDFDINMLLGFCALSLTNNNIDRSKTPIDMVHDTVLNNELGKLIGDFGIIVPVSGSALDIVANSISGVDELSDLWDNGYNIFTRFQLVHSGNEGILPRYIIVGFLAIIILYLLRK